MNPERERSRLLIDALLKKHNWTKIELSNTLGYKSSSNLGEVYAMRANFNPTAKKALKRELNVNNEWLEEGVGEMFTDGYIPGIEKGSKTIIQPVVIDADEREYITYVPVPAQAGFAREYPKVDYMQRLPHFNIPNYHNGAALAFSVEGDSMTPTLRPNNIVIAEPVEKPEWIDPKGIHVVIADRGTLIKRFIYHKDADFTGADGEENKGFLEWISDNDFYNNLPLHQRSVPINEVNHIFKVVMKIGRDMPAPDETLKLIKEILTKVDAIARRDINLG